MNSWKYIFYIVIYLCSCADASAAWDMAYLENSDGYWQAWVMDRAKGKTKVVTRTEYDKSSISWYPDGKSLLINGNQGQLARVDIQTGQEYEIKTKIEGMVDAVISHDGSQIVFTLSGANGRDANDVWIMSADGTGLRKIINAEGLQHEPKWSLDDNWIYFLTGVGHSHDIWRTDINGQQKEQMTVGHLYHFDVSVSVDGSLAYSNNRTGNYEIWIKNKEGVEKQVTDNEQYDARPCWSKEGDAVYYESRVNGVMNIFKMNINDKRKTPEQITYSVTGARNPVVYY